MITMFFSCFISIQVPVPALKEQIASVTGVVTEQQRLICRGQVMKDDQLLSAYRILSLLFFSPLCLASFLELSFLFVDPSLLMSLLVSCNSL